MHVAMTEAAACPRDLHPLALEVAEALAHDSRAAAGLAGRVPALRQHLLALRQDELLWALDSLVVLAARLVARGASAVADLVLDVATAATPRLVLDNAEYHTRRRMRAARQLTRVQRRGAVTAATGKPAWQLDGLRVAPRRV